MFPSGVKASMTVEAAVVLPLFLSFFLYMMGIMEMMRFQGLVSFALWNAGNKLTVYEVVEEEYSVRIPDVLTSYTLVRNEIASTVGKDRLANSPVEYGINGFMFLDSEYSPQKGIVHIVCTYPVSPPLVLFPTPSRRMVEEYYGRVWNGYEASNSDEVTEYVYVTTYGRVWHASSSCSALHVSIQETDYKALHFLTNQEGQKYVPCSFCVRGDAAKLYVTKQGDCYHERINCRGLKRTVQVVPKEKVKGRNPCKKCVREGK